MFEGQTVKWKTKKWTLKEWKFRAIPLDEITMEFQAMSSEEVHLCEECGFSTTTEQKEEDILFVSERYNLHYHKWCFLAVLQENRGQRAIKTVLEALGQFWMEIEENRVLNYLQEKQIANTINLTHNDESPIDSDKEVDECILLSQDDTIIDRKQKSVKINNSIEVNTHHNRGDLLFTKLVLANLGDIEIEALVDIGPTTSFIKQGAIPDSYMVTLEKPYIGSGANSIPFTIKRRTKSLFLRIKNT